MDWQAEKDLTTWQLWAICFLLGLVSLSALENVPGVTNDSASYIRVAQGLLHGLIIPLGSAGVRLGFSAFLTLPCTISRIVPSFIDPTLAAKLFMIIMNSASLFLFFQFCKLRGLSANKSLLAVFVLAINSKFIGGVTAIGIDNALLFLLLLSIYMLAKAQERGDSLVLYACGSAVAGFAVLTKGSALGMLLPLAVISYEIARERRRVVWVEIAVLLGPFLIFWGASALLNMYYKVGSVIPVSYLQVLQSTSLWTNLGSHFVPFAKSLGRIYGPIIPLLAVIPGAIAIRRRQDLYIIAFILSQWLIMFVMHPFLPRYYLPTLPFVIFFALQFPKVISELPLRTWLQRCAKPIFIVAMILNIALFSGLIIRFIALPGYRLGNNAYFNRDVAEWINATTSSETIIATGGVGEGVLLFYLNDSRSVISMGEMESDETIQDFMERTGASYLVYIKPTRTLGYSAAERYAYPKWAFLDDVGDEHPHFIVARIISQDPKVVIYQFWK